MKTTLVISALLATALAAAAVPRETKLSDAQQTELIKLYEEEVMAHDLYVALGKIHPEIRPFQNIPHSERRHRDAILAIMEQYQVEVPKSPKNQRFVSGGLDTMFKKLLAKGRQSPAAACKVGVGFEELDIAELRAAQETLPFAKDTLAQLEWASGNHLRAFHRNLTAHGGQYKATHLKKKDLKNILAGKGPQAAVGCGKGNAGTPKSGGCNRQCRSCDQDAAPGQGKGRGKGKGRRQGRGNGNGPGHQR